MRSQCILMSKKISQKFWSFMSLCPKCGYEYPDGCDATCDYKHPMVEWISIKDRLPPVDWNEMDGVKC